MLGRALHAALVTTTLIAVALLVAPAALASGPACDSALNLGNVHTGESVHGTLTCDDPSGTGLNYSVAVGHEPHHGAALLDGAGGIDYYADADYAGPDSFRLEIDDNIGGTTYTDVSVTIANERPMCSPATIETVHDHVGSATASCTDSDGDALQYVITTQPSHGTAAVDAGGHITYTPGAGYVGPDSFHFAAADGVVSSAAATASVSVTNARPLCGAAAVTTPPATKVTVHLNCADGDSDPLTITVVSGPDAAAGTVGTIDQLNKTVEFTPASGFAGDATFTFKASDASEDSAPATATVTVASAQSQPAGGAGVAGSGTDSPGAGGNTPQPGPAVDRLAPGLTLGSLPKLKLAKLVKAGLPIVLTLTENCTVTAKLTLPKVLAKKLRLAAADVAVGTTVRSVKAGPSTLTIKLSAKARKKLAKVSSLKLLLTVVATDAAGNKKSLAKSLLIKR